VEGPARRRAPECRQEVSTCGNDRSRPGLVLAS